MKIRSIVFFLLSAVTCLCLSAKVRTLSFCIGIYPAESGWNALGANNDAALIKAQFTDARIITNDNAICSNILSELARLKRNVNSGDTVIIHFSGHGQQILSTTSSAEVDLVDEALVSYDAAKRKSATYNGQAHISDDVFGEYIAGIRKAVGPDGLVIAVIDACHSDSMDKNAEDSEDVYRGTDEIFGTENLSPDSIAKLRELYNSPDKSPVFVSPELSDVVFISACGTHQRNYEIKVNDTPYGSLTYYFCKVYGKNGFSDLNRFLSDLYAELTSDKVMKFHGQKPVIRNTLGWEAPMSETYEPTDLQPVREVENSLGGCWWYAAGGFVFIAIIIMLCRKRK